MSFNLNLNVSQASDTVKPNEPAVVDFDALYDILILGGGPTGINAAIYAKRKGLTPVIIAERLGGQLMDTSEVDNYLGLPGTSGYDLAMRYVEHGRTLSIPMIESVRANRYETKTGDNGQTIHTLGLSDGRSLSGKSVLLATGSTPRHLGIPGESELAGMGVSYCAICDGFFFRNKTVVIAGGGNAAIEAAIDMSKIAADVIVVQRSTYRADQVLLDQVDQLENVKRLEQTQMTRILGTNNVTGIEVYSKQEDKTYEIETSAVFVEIGHDANPGPFGDIIARNAAGEIIIDERHQTNLPGVYAAGDVTTEPFKQIIIAAAAGASAALCMNQDLNRLSAASVDHTMGLSIAERN